VDDLDALPKPMQDDMPLIVGGNGGPRSAALAARFASEYNMPHADPATVGRARAALDAACEAVGRDPATLPLSLMNGFLIGAADREVRARAERVARVQDVPADPTQLAPVWIVGTPEQVIARLREYADAGLERVMLQHHLVDDDDVLELIAAEIAPAIA
jgi:alkanesulfonate monooxygenase SsuD/methylene tetrahydromethanopterin reductase-like flavin-dependent oxidoreductase (luciferase family)